MDILHLAAPCRNVPVTFTLDLTMSFEWREGTEMLLRELGLPVWLPAGDKFNPLGKTLICDVAERIAVFPHPYGRTDYPDYSFGIFIGAVQLSGWASVRFGDHFLQRVQVRVPHPDDLCPVKRGGLTDTFLQQRLGDAFALLHGPLGPTSPVVIEHVKPSGLLRAERPGG